MSRTRHRLSIVVPIRLLRNKYNKIINSSLPNYLAPPLMFSFIIGRKTQIPNWLRPIQVDAIIKFKVCLNPKLQDLYRKCVNQLLPSREKVGFHSSLYLTLFIISSLYWLIQCPQCPLCRICYYIHYHSQPDLHNPDINDDCRVSDQCKGNHRDRESDKSWQEDLSATQVSTRERLPVQIACPKDPNIYLKEGPNSFKWFIMFKVFVYSETSPLYVESKQTNTQFMDKN